MCLVFVHGVCAVPVARSATPSVLVTTRPHAPPAAAPAATAPAPAPARVPRLSQGALAVQVMTGGLQLVTQPAPVVLHRRSASVIAVADSPQYAIKGAVDQTLLGQPSPIEEYTAFVAKSISRENAGSDPCVVGSCQVVVCGPACKSSTTQNWVSNDEVDCFYESNCIVFAMDSGHIVKNHETNRHQRKTCCRIYITGKNSPCHGQFFEKETSEFA